MSSGESEKDEDSSLHLALLALLEESGAHHEVLEHAPVKTSVEAAEVRGSRLSQGAKAMIFRSKGKFYLAVIAADKRIDSKKFKRVVGLRSCALASRDEVWQLGRVLPGGVPPFGSLLGGDGVPTYCDESLRREQVIEFNAGLRGKSVRIDREEYERVEKPTFADYAKDE